MTGLGAVHDTHGVRWTTDAAGAALPRNYGDPAGEYDAARTGAAVVDRSDRRFVRVHGRDPVKMLQGLISNDLAGAPAERAVYATVLTPKGRMVADVRVLRRDAELLMETDAAALDPLLAHLRKYVPPLFARFEDVTAHWAMLGVYGPHAHDMLARVLGSAPGTREDDAVVAQSDDHPVIVVTTSYAGVPGYDVIAAPVQSQTLFRQLTAEGARPAGHATLDVLRIEAGTPRWGAELDDTTIPLEAGLRTRAISETKGCYTGQEVIIRILHRGHVNRQLRGVLLGDVAAPPVGTELFDDTGARALGRITSAAWSPKHGQTIALAYVRREVAPPAELHVGSASGPDVRIVALPFND